MKYLFYVLMLASRALAGGEAGNGGDVIIYKDGRVEVLDHYEAKKYGTVDLPGATVQEKVFNALERLKTGGYSCPEKMEQFKLWFSTFEKDARRLKNITLLDIPDSQHILLPAKSEIHQIVVQIFPKAPWEKRYIINQDLYERLDDDNKATIILHELIFRTVVDGYASTSNSISSRNLNAAIITNKIQEYPGCGL